MSGDWFDERAKRFWLDVKGCPDDTWMNKRTCPHCVAELLREAARIGESVERERVMEEMDDLFSADSREYAEIKSRVVDFYDGRKK